MAASCNAWIDAGSLLRSDQENRRWLTRQELLTPQGSVPEGVPARGAVLPFFCNEVYSLRTEVEMTRSSWLRIAALIVLFAGGVAGFVFLRNRMEERRLYADFQDLLKPEADTRYNALSLGPRLATARRAKPAADALRRANWTAFATNLQPVSDQEDAYDFVYQLQLGDSELAECVVDDPVGDPAGSCQSFSHVVPEELRDTTEKGLPPRRTQNLSSLCTWESSLCGEPRQGPARPGNHDRLSGGGPSVGRQGRCPSHGGGAPRPRSAPPRERADSHQHSGLLASHCAQDPVEPEKTTPSV